MAQSKKQLPSKRRKGQANVAISTQFARIRTKIFPPSPLSRPKPLKEIGPQHAVNRIIEVHSDEENVGDELEELRAAFRVCQQSLQRTPTRKHHPIKYLPSPS